MAVVYNYFEPIPIPGPENPKFDSRIYKTCSKAQKNWKGKKIDSLRRRRLGQTFFLKLNENLL